MATGFEMRHENDVVGLGWIHRFGWLRSAELGRLMWPGDTYARTRADRVIRGWIARGLVIERNLPDGARRAVVLSVAGARLLQGAGVVEARSGKDWGETIGGNWRPNTAWQHDLVAAGVLAHLYELDYDVIPEKALRRDNPGLTKVPDGLACKDEQVIWLEVEHARKTGQAMHDLAAALCAVAGGGCKLVSGMRPTMPMVAFIQGDHDERRHHINHFARVSAALQKVAKVDVPVLWAKCELSGCGVVKLTMLPETIAADRATRILEVLNASGWAEDETGCLVSHYAGVKAVVWCDDDMGWSYQAEGQGATEIAYQATDISDAKRGCASLIARI